MKNTLIFLLGAILIFSCKSEKSTNTNSIVEEKVSKEVNKYKLTPFTPSPEYKDAKITSMNYKSNRFEFGVVGNDYELGAQTPDAPQKMCANSGKGQHIHLIVDNKPYAAKYTADFDYEIPDGDHHILAFLSRSYHESIKTADAHVAEMVTVKDGSILESKTIGSPMLFYSRPKGTYVGQDTKKVMLDFYLSNTTLGMHKVKADINGEIHVLDNWQPYYIEGLPIGENTITLTLIDSNGEAIQTALNPVSRTFTLKNDPTPEKS